MYLPGSLTRTECVNNARLVLVEYICGIMTLCYLS